MIEINEKYVKIEGTNSDILANVMMLVDELINMSPEIINAVVAGYTTKLANSLEACNPVILKMLVEIVEEYNERKEQ